MPSNGTVTHVHSWRYERNGVVRCDCGETNAARGTDPHYADAARLAATLGKPGPMSAAEREQQRIAYIAAVDGMATVLRSLEIEFDPAHGYSVSKADRVLFNLVHGHSGQLAGLMKASHEQKRCCQERWDVAAAADHRIADRHRAFVARTFWQRLRWLVLGR